MGDHRHDFIAQLPGLLHQSLQADIADIVVTHEDEVRDGYSSLIFLTCFVKTIQLDIRRKPSCLVDTAPHIGTWSF